MDKFKGRWNHVAKLWKNALSQEGFPQFDRWLSNEFAKNSQYGSKDRRWYSEILFAGVRHGYFALFCSFLEGKNPTPELIESFQKKYQTPQSLFQGIKNIPTEEFFSWICLRYASTASSEITFIKELEDNQKNFYSILEQKLKNGSIQNQFIYHSVPLWFLPFFQKRVEASNLSQDQVEKFLTDLNTRPPLWIRINHEDKKDEVLAELEKENYQVKTLNSTMEVHGAKGVFTLNSYRQGFFEIQDLASQQIGQHVQAEPKDYVWDCCAGGGGKTLQIASFLKNKGVLYASDIREYKLEEVKKRAKRSGFFNIRCLKWEGEELPPFQKEIQTKGGFHWVLVDAPCSSSGTWRRNPDAKYRVQQENLNELKQIQLKLLSSASKAVLKNGHLVYSTCSWLLEENEKIVEEFLKIHPHFQLIKQNLLGNPFENSDSMFTAVLKYVI